MDFRLIPARAGNTPSGSSAASAGSAHPRSRGEHERLTVRAGDAPGSSPLARGTPRESKPSTIRSRLIPARAGNTAASSAAGSASSAHPRSRGEHADCTGVSRLVFGSSPLARGTQPTITCIIAGFRLIPARAGNTLSGATSPRSAAAHPRSRGEHKLNDSCVHCWHGSSPLARGTPEGESDSSPVVRLIPARAGNTGLVHARVTRATAHPRSRGEHYRSGAGLPRRRGSSPLARGTPRS